MENANRGTQRFFLLLASLIRTTDFILAGGGVFKNLVWLILAAIVGPVIEHAHHLSILGWFLFFVAAVIARFIIEATLVGLAAWVSRHLSDEEEL